MIRLSLLLVAAAVATTASSPAYGDQPPGCTLARPSYDIVGPDQQSRYKTVKGGVTLLNAFLTTEYNDKVKQSIDAAIKQPAVDASDALKWSREKGAVIEVVLERDSNQFQPAKLLYVAYIGVGPCMYDVLASQWSKPQLYPSPDAGYHIDDDSSFFAWETYEGGKATLHVDVPGSRAPILDRVRADGETAKVLNQRQTADEGRRLLALADEAKTMEGVLAAQRELDAAALAIRDGQQRFSTIDAALQTALFEQGRLQAASDATASFQKILSLASLAANAENMLSSDLTQEEKLKLESAKSADDIRGLIALKITETKSKIEYEQGQYKSVQEVYQKNKSYIVDKARTDGAPKSVLP